MALREHSQLGQITRAAHLALHAHEIKWGIHMGSDSSMSAVDPRKVTRAPVRTLRRNAMLSRTVSEPGNKSCGWRRSGASAILAKLAGRIGTPT